MLTPRPLASAFLLIALMTVPAAVGRAQTPASRDVIVTFTANDGTPLEGKLSLPASATGPVPVVFYLHGAGPRTYDHAIRYRTAAGEVATINYYDSHAAPLAAEGMAFFRISKRGCTADPSGRPVVDRAVFSKATPTVLLDDYASALDALRQRPEVDASRIVLFGSSEGTRLAALLARRSPDGIVGLVLTSYAGDNQRDTVEWQNSVGPWRNVVALAPAAADGRLTRAEYDEAVAKVPSLTTRLPFVAIDADKDDVMTSAELARLVAPRLAAIRQAVESGNDDFLWQNLLNLTSAYLRDGWDGPPTRDLLLPLTVPIAIFHGALDGTTRVEAVEETAAAFASAGRKNLVHRIYPTLDHDLGWTPSEAANGGSAALRDAFRAAIEMAARRPRN
jgi:pimeloyl-ACP methyl ester carboxylesterase